VGRPSDIDGAARPASSSRRGSFDRDALSVYLLTALVGAGTVAGMMASGLRFASGFWIPPLVVAFLLILIAWALRGRGLLAIPSILEAWALWLILCLCFTLLTFAVATQPHRFIDADLAHADRVLFPFFDWPKEIRAFSTMAAPLRVANWVYESIRWQPTLLLIVLSVTKRYREVWRFVLTWNVALTIVVVIFAFAPGLGAYAHFGIAHRDVPGMGDPTPWHQARLLGELANGTLVSLRPGDLDGIVTFPSFHTAAAVILAGMFWPSRLFRWPMLALNALMILAAIPVGGHYLVDILAGAATAAAAIVAVKEAPSFADMRNWLSRRGARASIDRLSRPEAA
jgi:membrane-associated phospholipid phosphatase